MCYICITALLSYVITHGAVTTGSNIMLESCADSSPDATREQKQPVRSMLCPCMAKRNSWLQPISSYHQPGHTFQQSWRNSRLVAPLWCHRRDSCNFQGAEPEGKAVFFKYYNRRHTL